MLQFVGIVHQAVMNQDAISVDQLAEELGKKPSTLYNELNPRPAAGSSAKLGLENAVYIMKRLGHHGLARAIAHEFGLVSSPESCPIPDKSTMEEEMLDDYPALTAVHDAMRRGADTETVRELVDAAKLDIDETLAMYESGQFKPITGQVMRGGKWQGVRQ